MDLEPSDLALLKGIAAGRDADWRRFVDRWAPRLGTFLLHATRSRETAEDLLQDLFVRVMQAAPRFDERPCVAAWLYRIAANLAYSHWRRVSVERAFEGDLRAAGEGQQSPRGEEARAARAAVIRLPQNQRMVFLLKAAAGLTYAEIGETLGCPEGTAKSRFHHALLRLRAELVADTPERREPHVV